MKVNQKKYEVPTVKVVDFMVEHGFAGSGTLDMEIRSIDPQTGGGDGDVPEQNEQMFYRELGGSNS